MGKEHKQTEELDATSLDILPDQNDEYDYMGDDDDPDLLVDEEGEGDDDEEVKPSMMDRLTGGVNLTGKQIGFLIAGIALTVVIVFVFKPFDSIFNKDGDVDVAEASGEESEGFFAKIKGIFSSDSDEIDIAVSVPQEVLDFVAYHEEQYPGYDYTYNEMDGSITFTGLNEEGLYHDLIYDITNTLVAEYVDGVEVFNNIAQVVEESTEPEPSAEATDDGSGKVSIDKATYNNSTISLPLQKPKAEYDEYDNPVESVSQKRLIVQFFKLPLTGKVPNIKAVVAETDEVIIFPVSLTQYVQLPDKGSTVIELTVTEGHGAIGYSDIKLVNWQR